MENILYIRGGFFVGALFLFSVIQLIIPSRRFQPKRWQVIASNLLVVLVNNLLIGLLPLIPFQAAVVMEDKSFGLLKLVETPSIITIIIGVVLLDIVIYWQHRLFHQIDFLWAFHRMHHVDPMLDTTSGLRFHPVEVFISNFVKVGAIILLGVSPLAVIIFELALNVLAMFNHSNIRIHKKVEQVISLFLITPALHTIHHSKIMVETNSNYGFSVPWWDKIFGTFIKEGKYSQENIHIGTVPMPEYSEQVFPGMLKLPFHQLFTS